MAKKISQFAHARSEAEKALERQEAEHRRQLLQHRIQLASKGVSLFKSGKVTEAVTAFHSYINILEDWKEVDKGGLHPGLFDPKIDLAEMLLISGVYWDLCKLYDHTKSAEKRADFQQYLGKFILFSKGMPFQTLSAETARKYVASGKSVHRLEFKNAYRQLATSKCFVATSLIDVCDERTLPRLRLFRDEYLEKRLWGRAFTRLYYFLGPAIANSVDRSPEFLRRALACLLDLAAQASSR